MTKTDTYFVNEKFSSLKSYGHINYFKRLARKTNRLLKVPLASIFVVRQEILFNQLLGKHCQINVRFVSQRQQAIVTTMVSDFL